MLKTKKLVDCQKTLDFKPLALWPKAFAPLCWGDVLMTGFDRDDEAIALDQSTLSEDFTESFLASHPRLSLSELARLRKCYLEGSAHLPSLRWDSLLPHYGLREHDNLYVTLDTLARTPMEFQNWVSEKALKLGDLAILRSLEQLQPEALDFFSQLSELGLSKSQGVQTLEWGLELILMGKGLESLQNQNSPEAWVQQLHQLRHPNASHRDQGAKTQVKQLPWPKGTQVEWKRWGDRSGLELRLRLDNLEQLEDRARALMHTFEVHKKAQKLQGEKSL